MTNLEYLAWFLEDTVGAICFHNDTEDGYREWQPSEGLEVETLAVYFPNKVDLEDKEVAERLVRKSGKDFYKRYKGTQGLVLCPIGGSVLFVRYSYNGETIKFSPEPFDGAVINYAPLQIAVLYFLGYDISHVNVKYLSYVSMETNNGFDFGINSDMEIAHEEFLTERKKATYNGKFKANLEKFLIKHEMPLVTAENDFIVDYERPLPIGERLDRGRDWIHEKIQTYNRVKINRKACEVFGDEYIAHVKEIAKKRLRDPHSLQRFMTRDEVMAFLKADGWEYIKRARLEREKECPEETADLSCEYWGKE